MHTCLHFQGQWLSVTNDWFLWHQRKMETIVADRALADAAVTGGFGWMDEDLSNFG